MSSDPLQALALAGVLGTLGAIFLYVRKSVSRDLNHADFLAKLDAPLEPPQPPERAIWVYVPSKALEQPWLKCCAATILQNGGARVCFVDDKAILKLVPDWKTEKDAILAQEGSAPQVHARIALLGMARILYHYGGTIVPLSYVCSRSLLPLIDSEYPFACDHSIGGNPKANFAPSPQFMGAPAEHSLTSCLVAYLRQKPLNPAADPVIETSLWLKKQAELGKVSQINAAAIGSANTLGEPFTADDLVGRPTYVPTQPSAAYGLWVPLDAPRFHSSAWLAYSPAERVLSGEYALAVALRRALN